MLANLARGMQERGHMCALASPEEGPLYLRCNASDIAYHIVPNLFETNHAASHRRLRTLLKQLRPDVIVVNTILGFHLVSWLRSHAPDTTILWWLHESEREAFARTLPDWNEDAFTQADAVIAGSKATMDVYGKIPGIRSGVLHAGIDTAEIDTYRSHADAKVLRRQLGLPVDGTIFSSIGTICPRKGQREFLESALLLLLEHREWQTHFLLVGKQWTGHEHLLDAVLERARVCGVRDRIHIHPETRDIFSVYACTDIFVCNAFIECFPRVILEAMAFGLPIIAGKTYGVAEQIEDGGSGLLVLPGNRRMLSDAMAKMLMHPDRAARMGLEARATLEERFTLNNMLDAFEDIVRECRGAALFSPAQSPRQ